jgi:hypothetical protein
MGCRFDPAHVTVTSTAPVAATVSFTVPSGLMNGSSNERLFADYPGGLVNFASHPFDLMLTVPSFGLPCGGTVYATVAWNHTESTFCTLTSIGGFTGPVELSCTGLPSPAVCVLSPSSPVVPKDGTVEFSFSVYNYGKTPATYDFDLVAKSGTVVRTAHYQLVVS